MRRSLLLLVAAAFSVGPAWAVRTYQVTGPVLELTDTTIVVEKGKDKWEIARGPGTKITGNLQKGAKVTVEYTMSATAVEVKGGKAK